MSNSLTDAQRASLKSILQRISQIDKERKALSEDMKELMVEAKSNGLEPKFVKDTYKVMSIGPTQYLVQTGELEEYLNAAGVITYKQDKE